MGCCQHWVDPSRHLSTQDRLKYQSKLSSYYKNSLDISTLDYKLQSLKSLLKHSVVKSESVLQSFTKQVASLDLRFSRKNTRSFRKHSEELECPACSFVYNRSREKPLMLPCGHSFCKKCIEKEYNKYRRVRCPVDKTEYKENPEQFPVVFSLISLAESIARTPYCPSHSKPITHYSPSGRSFLCELCPEYSPTMEDLIEINDSIVPVMKEWYDSAVHAASDLKNTQLDMINAKEQAGDIERQVDLALNKHLLEVKDEYSNAAKEIQHSVDNYIAEVQDACDKLNLNSPSKALDELAEAIKNEIKRATEFVDKFEELNVEEKVKKFAQGNLPSVEFSLPESDAFYHAIRTLKNIDYNALFQSFF